MSDVKGHDRAASLRPSPPRIYGLALADIQAHLAEWLRQYGPAGVLALHWELNDGLRHEPTLRPQGPPPREELHSMALAEADGPWPDVLDVCPCPDCSAPIIWTVLDDVRTAWSVHHCPRSGGKPLSTTP